MMKNLCAVSFLVASLYAGNVYAQPAAVKKIIEIGTTDNRVMHQLDVLTNRFGGRPIGSDAYDNAAEWMLREFRSWGIEAHLEEAGELPVGFNRGPWFVVFVLALQQLDGNVIGPKILGDRTGLSSFWVLFTIILFGGLWGVFGMVIGVPLFGVIYDTVKKLVRRGLDRKGQIEVWEKYKADYPDEEPKKT